MDDTGEHFDASITLYLETINTSLLLARRIRSVRRSRRRPVPIDLNNDVTTIRARMHQTHRNGIAQAVREGVVVEHDPDCKHLDEFIALYDCDHAPRRCRERVHVRPPCFEKLRDDPTG